MTFNRDEVVAITRLAHVMIMADGSADKREISTLSRELARFGLNPEQQAEMLGDAMVIRPIEAMQRIAHMEEDQKRYVSAFLANAMISNGEIDDAELAQWRQLTQLCELPEMTLEQALTYLINLDE